MHVLQGAEETVLNSLFLSSVSGDTVIHNIFIFMHSLPEVHTVNGNMKVVFIHISSQAVLHAHC